MSTIRSKFQWRLKHPTILCAGMTIIATLLFASMNVLLKGIHVYFPPELSGLMAVFLRYIFGFVILVPIFIFYFNELITHGVSAVHVFRSIFGIGGLLFLFLHFKSVRSLWSHL